MFLARKTLIGVKVFQVIVCQAALQHFVRNVKNWFGGNIDICISGCLHAGAIVYGQGEKKKKETLQRTLYRRIKKVGTVGYLQSSKVIGTSTNNPTKRNVE